MTWNTLDEERAEVWTALVEEMPRSAADRDLGAAVRRLLRHLVVSGASLAEDRGRYTEGHLA